MLADAEGIPVENPATGELIATVPNLREGEIAQLVAQARAAQPEWNALGFDGRGRILRRAQKWMVDHSERVLETVAQETGKTIEDVQNVDFTYTVAALGFWPKHGPRYLANERVRSWSTLTTLGRTLALRYVPVGVVGVIGPWNYPITNSFGDAIPALMAGNSVILKPSEVTPMSSLLMAEMLTECGIPEGVFQVATGDGATGSAVVAAVDCVMFTGSTATGRKVARVAADALIPCYLELGGKDPMIVCADANLERAANAAVYHSMGNAGQTCISVERVYVEEGVYDDFLARVTEKVRALRQGPPGGGPGSVDVGAMIFPPQAEIVADHVRDAVQRGARVLTGGDTRDGERRFFEPTVLVDVDHTMKCMTEETFGPTIPIMKVTDAEQGLRLANDSPYGLQASIWTSDIKRGKELAARTQAGAVCVNDAAVNFFALNLPMGGWKSSGIGTRHGAAGIRKYCKIQSLLVTRWALNREPFMFPYRATVTLLLRRGIGLLYGRGRR